MRSRWRGRAASVLWPAVSGRIHRPDRTFNLGDAEWTTDNFLADGAGPQHRSAVEHPSPVTKTSWLRTGRERRHSLLSGRGQGGHEEQRSALEKRSSWSDESSAPHAIFDEARGIDWRSDPFAIGATFANPRHPDIVEEWHLHSVGFHFHSAEKRWTPATRHLRFTYAYVFKPDPPSSASEDGGNQSARFDGPTKLLPGPKYRRAPSPPGLLLAAWKYEAAQHPDVEGSGRATNRTAMRCLTFKLPSAEKDAYDWRQTVNVNADALQAADCERWRWRPRDEVPEMAPLMRKGWLGRRNIWQLQAVLPAAEEKNVGGPHCLRSMPRHVLGAKMRVELAPCNATLQPGTGFFGVLKRLPADKFRRAFSLPSNTTNQSNSSSSHKVEKDDPLTVDLTKDVFSLGRSVHTVGRFCVKAKTLAEGAGEDDPGVVDCKRVNAASKFGEEARVAFAFKRAGGADDQSGHVLRPGFEEQGEAQNLTPRKRWPSIPGILVSAGDYSGADHAADDEKYGGLPLTPTFAKSPSSDETPVSCLTFESEDMFRQLFDHDGKKKLLRTAHYKKLLRSRIGVHRRPTADGCARWRWFPLWKNPVDMHEGPVRNMWELRLYLPPQLSDGTLAPQCLQTETLSTSLPMPLSLRDCGGGGEVPEQRLRGMVTATIPWQRWAVHRLDARKFPKVWQKPRRSKTSTSTSRPEDAKGGMPASVLLILMVAGSVGIGMLVGLPIAHFAGCALCGYSEGPLDESEEESEFRDSTSGRAGGRALGAAKGKGGGGRAGSGSGANAQEGGAGPTSAFDFFWSDGPSSKGKKKVRRKKR